MKNITMELKTDLINLFFSYFRTKNNPRRGYMGHLVKISNNIVEQAQKGPLGALIKETVDSETLTNWETFVTTQLADINQTHSKCLVSVAVSKMQAIFLCFLHMPILMLQGGTHPLQSNNEDNNVECSNKFVLDNNLQEVCYFLFPFFNFNKQGHEMIKTYSKRVLYSMTNC